MAALMRGSEASKRVGCMRFLFVVAPLMYSVVYLRLVLYLKASAITCSFRVLIEWEPKRQEGRAWKLKLFAKRACTYVCTLLVSKSLDSSSPSLLLFFCLSPPTYVHVTFFFASCSFFFFVCVERRGCPVSCMWSTALESKSEKRNMQANQWGELFLGLFANHENKEKRTVFSFFSLLL